MNWRSVIVLLLLAFVGGGVGFAWLSSDGSLPWETPKESAETPAEDQEAPVLALPATVAVPQAIIQPSASQSEAMLLVLSARRAMEAGKPLGDLASRLQVSFEQSQPQALATIAQAARKPVSNAMLLQGFDALAPQLTLPNGSAWDRIRYEMATLFVIRTADAKPKVSAAKIAKAREAIIAGDIDVAVGIVRDMPGASKAKDWLTTADRALAVRQAFDRLNQAAATPPVPPTLPAPLPAPPAPAIDQTLPADGE